MEQAAVPGDLKSKLEYAEAVTQLPQAAFQRSTEQTSPCRGPKAAQELSECPIPLRSPLEAAPPTQHMG